MREKISIVGAGAWGTALACISSRAGHETLLWGRSQEVVDEINAKKTNQKYLGNLELHRGIKATTNLSDALDKSSLILLSIPTQTISSRLQDFPTIPAETIIVTTCKGID
ncbi:MAG: NAD(P)-binding domain-containing protein, partial [Pseudomonadota bacterium]